MQPGIVEQRAHPLEASEDFASCLTRRIDRHRQAQRLMAKPPTSGTACQGSPARSVPPLPSTTPKPPTTLWIGLLPAPIASGATEEP